MENFLDAMHQRARRSYWLARLAISTRILLAAAFLPTGWVKVLNRRFTSVSPTQPVGALFEALYQTGGYWQFLGWAQVTAAVLLLVPATTAIGALIFLALAINIFVITVSIGFSGTPVVTGLMLLAVLFLVCWDYHRWKRLLFAAPAADPAPLPPLHWRGWEKVLLSVGGVAGMLFFLGTRSLVPATWSGRSLLVAVLAAAVVGALWIAQDLQRARQMQN